MPCYRNIFERVPADSKYVSDPFEDEMNLDFFPQRMETSDLDNHVGYECSYMEHGEESVKRYVYISDYLRAFRYPLERGRWIENNEEIVIGGNHSSQYELGDSYYIGSQYIGKIVGDLGKEYRFMLLNVSGEDLNYDDIFTSLSEDIFVTNNKQLLDLCQMEVSSRAIMVDSCGYEELSKQGFGLEKNQDFRKMQEGKYENKTTRENKIMIVFLILATVFTSFYLLYLYCCKNITELGVMKEQGYCDYELTIYLIVPVLIDIMVSYIGVCIYSLKTFGNDIANNNLYVILLLIVIVSIVCVFALIQNTMKRKGKRQ